MVALEEKEKAKALGFILSGPWVCANMQINVYKILCQIFHRILENLDLIVALDEELRDHQGH